MTGRIAGKRWRGIEKCLGSLEKGGGKQQCSRGWKGAVCICKGRESYSSVFRKGKGYVGMCEA